MFLKIRQKNFSSSSSRRIKGTAIFAPALVCIALFAGPVCAETFHWTGLSDSTWSVSANWSPPGPPGAGDIVVIDTNSASQPVLYAPATVYSLFLATSGAYNSTLTLNASLTITSSITVGQKGTLTHAANTTAQFYTLALTASSMTIEAGGVIDVTGRGYDGCNQCAGRGPGASGTVGLGGQAGGAGHGGEGQDWGSTGGTTYGNHAAPTSIGSSAGSSVIFPGKGGSGGGAIRLIIAGTLVNNGVIQANGMQGTGDRCGNGAGGSIYLTVGAWEGSGTIAADGGPQAYGGGGGGGRIAVEYTTKTSTVTPTAYGGYGAGAASPGTVFLKPASSSGTLIVDNRSVAPASGKYAYLSAPGTSGEYTFGNIEVRGKGVFATGNNTTFSTITVSGDILGDWTGITQLYGSLNLQSTSFSVIGSTVYLTPGLINGLADITLGTSTLLETSTGPAYVVGRMTLYPGAVFRHGVNAASIASWFDLKVTTLTVSAGAQIALSGRGYTEGNGPSAATGSSGGGHGGAGGNGNTGAGGAVNDSDMDPVLPGSGAGTTNSGGSGGGAIRIVSTGTVTIDGTLAADGADGLTDAAGGGAGGSINITAKTFQGSGTLSARGGNATANGGGGGGGRVVISTNSGAGYINWSGNNLCDGSLISGGTGLIAGASGTMRLNGSADCDTNAPAAVTDLYASSGSAGGSIELSWTAPGDDGSTGLIGQGSYRIQYSTYVVAWSTAGAQVLLSTSGVSPGNPQRLSVGALIGNATYYVRVWTSDEIGNWSPVSNGATAYALVRSPVLSLPGNGAWVRASTIAFRWEQNNTTDTINLWELDDNSDFSSILHSSSTRAVIFVSTAVLTHATTYSWRVRAAANQGGLSPAWSTSTFVVDLASSSAGGFRSLSSTAGVMGESQYNDLASGVTVQLTVQDANSGLAYSLPLPLDSITGTVGLWHLDDASGTDLQDSSPNGRTGTLVNSPTWDTGDCLLGSCLSLAGGSNNQYARLPAPDLGTTNAPFTISMWVRPAANSGALAHVTSQTDGLGWCMPFLGFDSGGRLAAQVWDGSARLAGPVATPLALNTWSYVAQTWSSSGGLSLYVNGVLAANTPVTSYSASGASNYVLAGHVGSGTTCATNVIQKTAFQGELDEVRVMNTAQTAQQVADDYRGRTFKIEYSSSAGQSWTTVLSSNPASTPYLALSGSEATTAAQTLQALRLSLAFSTNAVTCGGSSPCGATNQVKLHYRDVAGNVRTAGPYAVLVAGPANAVDVTAALSTGSWYNTSTFTFTSDFGNAAYYRYAWDTSATRFWTETEPQWLLSSGTLSLQAISDSGSWYLHLLPYNILDSSGPDRHIGPFRFDGSSPTLSAFQSLSSTAGALAEGQYNDLVSGVTAQLTVQDTISGLGHDLAPPDTVGLWHFDEGSGVGTVDFSTTAASGTLVNSPSWVPGRSLNALSFNGSNQYVNVPDNTAWDFGSDNFTIELWVRFNSVSGISSLMGHDMGGGPNPKWMLMLNYPSGNNLAFEMYSGGETVLQFPWTAATGEWYYLALARSGSDWRAYVNGQQIGAPVTYAGAVPNITHELTIGTDGENFRYTNGSIDEVRITKRALSAAQIRDNYNRAGYYYARYSTDAGASWQTVTSTNPGASPYLSLSGVSGSVDPQTFKIAGLGLAMSTNSAVCAGSSPCGATNQVKFYAGDLAGNIRAVGPYAIIAAAQPSAGDALALRSTGSWYTTSTFSFTSDFENAVYYRYAWDTSATHVWSYGETQWMSSSGTLSLQASSDGNNWYFHLLPYNVLDSSGVDRHIGPFRFDGSTPTAAAFRTFSSTGAALAENELNDLSLGVTVQITVQDGSSGLSSTNGGSGGTGGTITDIGGYRIHTFATSGTFTLPALRNVEVLLVGGGGGGGGYPSWHGDGGGGGGGVIYNASYSTAGELLTVGGGGARTAKGGDSVFGALTAIGGGYGGEFTVHSVGGNGGSGGGGSGVSSSYAGGAGTAGQGYNGGAGAVGGSQDGGGGGGGAGGAGAAGIGNTSGGYGGVGLAYSISGSETYYSGGGGGGTDRSGYGGAGGLGGGGNGYNAPSGGSAGAANTGGGGGGGVGGAGGSGIVIIRYYSGYSVLYSTNAGNTWRTILSTTPAASPYISLTGSGGSNSPENLRVFNLDLVVSSNSVVCGGSAPCGATNQVRFSVVDAAGNNLTTGPFAVRVAVAQPAVSAPVFIAVQESSVTAQWNANGNSTGTIYNLQASTEANFSTVLTSETYNTLAAIQTIDPNTTYYFRVNAAVGTNSSPYTQLGSTSTLALKPAGAAFASAQTDGVSASWAALPAAPSSMSAQGFILEASSTNFGALSSGGLVYSSATPYVGLSTLTVSGLWTNTTYYLRAGSFNHDQVPNYALLGGTRTAPGGPPGSPGVGEVFISSVTAKWAAVSSDGYELKASSTGFDGLGAVLSSSTADGNLDRLTVGGLLPDTTYAFQAGALFGASTTYASAGSTRTLAAAPGASLAAPISSVSVTVSWEPGANPAGTFYEVSYSSKDAFLTQPIYTAALTTSISLAISPLIPDTIYYFRVRAFNGNLIPSAFDAVVSTKTLILPPQVAGLAGTVNGISSITWNWSATPNTIGYELFLATQTAVRIGTSSSTEFKDTQLSTNSVRYLVVRATNAAGPGLFSAGATVYTLAMPPLDTSIAAVSSTTITLGWSANTNPPATLFEVSCSSVDAFATGGVISTSTLTGSLRALTGLLPMTTYYLRVRALNGDSVATDFDQIVSTLTPVAPPAVVAPTFLAVNNSSVAAQWGANGNLSGASYSLQSSTGPAFDSFVTSTTYNTWAVVAGLEPNTTYYFRAAAAAGGTSSPYTNFSATVTLANAPEGVQPAGVWETSATVNWIPLPASPSSHSASGYFLAASTAPDFTGILFSSRTTNVALSTLTVGGLMWSTTYYFRPGSLNWAGSASYGLTVSTRTRDVQGPDLLSPADGTYFNSHGFFFWSATTPTYRVQLDDDSGFGSVVLDSSAASAPFPITVSLASGGTYYWRVAGHGATSLWSSTRSFIADADFPSAAAFMSYSSTGGFISESAWNDLTAGVSAQITVQDALSGLYKGATGYLYTDPGTVGLWRMDEQGAAAADSSGRGNHLTPVNSPLKVFGRFGSAISLNGANQYLNRASPAGLPVGSTPRTVEAWIRFASVSNGGILRYGTASANQNFNFGYYNGQLWLGAGNNDCGKPFAPSAGQWYHVAFVYNGAGAGEFFVNGRSIGACAYTQLNTINDDLLIGYAAGPGYFNGAIDDVRVSNLALTQARVQSYYEEGYLGYYVSCSTDAGKSWNAVAGVLAGSQPYVSLTGSPGSAASQTLAAHNLSLAVSTTTATGLLATNQVIFHVSDRAGNLQSAGPYAILVATTFAPSPASPASGVYVNTAFPVLSWTVPGAMPRFQVQISSSAGFETVELDSAGITAAMYAPESALSPSVTHYWRVRSGDILGNWSGYSAASGLRVDITSPAFFSPAVKDIAGIWNSTMTAAANVSPEVRVNVQDLESGLLPAGFSLEYSTNAGVAWRAVNSTSTADIPHLVVSGVGASIATATAVGLTLANSPTQNRVRFSFRDSVGNIGVSEEYGIPVSAQSSTPTLIAPPAGAYAATARPAFNWSDGNTPASGQFSLLVDEDPGFSSPEISVQVSSPQYTSTTTLAEGLYYWKTRALHGEVWSGYSSTSSFTADLTGPVFASLEVMDLSGVWHSTDTSTDDLSPDVRIQVQDSLSGLAVNQAETGVSSDTVVLLHLDEGAGAPKDSSGRGNHIHENTAAWTAGRFGQGLVFSGAQYARGSLGDIGAKYTLEAWIKPAALSGGWHAIVARDTELGLFLTSDGKPDFYSGASLTGTSPLTPGVWHHVAGVSDTGVRRLYVDGRLQAAGSQANPLSGFWLGASSKALEFFEGTIDEVRITSRALSAEEIAAGYNSASAIYSKDEQASYIVESSSWIVRTTGAQGTKSIQVSTAGALEGVSHIRFIARDLAGNTSVSQTYAVPISVVSSSPSLTAPDDNAFSADEKPAFDWSDNNSPASHGFELLVDNNSSFISPEIDALTAASQYSSTASLSAGTYSWKVRARLGTQWSVYSSTRTLTLDFDGPAFTNAKVKNLAGVWQSTSAVTDDTTPDVRIAVQDAVSGLAVNQSVPGLSSAAALLMHFDEGAGLALDHSGRGNHAVLNTGQWVAGRFGQALSFDGYDQSAKIADSAGIDFAGNQDFAVVFWARFSSSENQSLDGIVEKWAGTGGYPYAFRVLGSGGISFARSDGIVSPAAEYAGNIGDNVWHQLAGVKDGAALKLYVDGIEAANAPDTASGNTLNDSPLSLGRRANGTLHFKGSIDELSVLGRKLSPEEIACLYNSAALSYSTDGGANYMLAASTSAIMTSGAAGATGVETSTAPALSDPSRLVNRVKFMARDQAGNTSVSEPYAIAISSGGSNPPQPLAPSDLAYTADSRPSFDWNDANAPLSNEYQLLVDDSPDLLSPEVNISTTASRYTCAAALPAGTYYWAARSRLGIEWSGYSSTRALVIDLAAPVFSSSEVKKQDGLWYVATTTTNDVSPDVRVTVQDTGSGLITSRGEASLSSGTVLLMHFNEGSGNPVDSSGRGNNAVSNSAAYGAGVFGQGLEFDGALARAGIQDSGDFDFTSYTLEAWVRTSGGGSEKQMLLSQQGAGGYWLLRLYNNRPQFCDSRGNVCLAADRLINDDSWHQVAAVREDGVQYRIYVDGLAVGSAAASSASPHSISSGVYIGAAGSGAERFSGRLDEVRILNRALNSSEVAASYHSAAVAYSRDWGSAYVLKPSSGNVQTSGSNGTKAAETSVAGSLELANTVSASQNLVKFIARDLAGNISVSDAYAIAVEGPPAVFDVAAGLDIANSSATVTWTTDKPATSQIRFGFQSGVYSTTQPVSVSYSAETATRTHSLTIGIVSGATYYFQAMSEDSLGGMGISGERSFETIAPFVQITTPAYGAVLSRPATVFAGALDSSGIDRVVFSLNGVAVSTSSFPPYSFLLDVSSPSIADGDYQVSAAAFDAAGNFSSHTVLVKALYAPPAPPVFNSPAAGSRTQGPVSLSGQAEPGAAVRVYVDSVYYYGNDAAADENGRFSVDLFLTREGTNTITAAVSDPKGTGLISAPLYVVMDTGAPGAPAGLEAVSLTDGRIRLSWSAPAGETPAFYNVYRTSNSFELISGSVAPDSLRLSSGSLTSFTDAPPGDGLWYYAVDSQDAIGNKSKLQDVAEAVSDSIAPAGAVVISSTPSLGPGIYIGTLTVTEAPQSVPMLTFTPYGLGPVPVAVSPGESPLVWKIQLTVSSYTPPGQASFSLETRDLVGNTGIALISGSVINLYTQGPVGDITLTPASPLKAQTVEAVLRLDAAAAQVPALTFTPWGREPVQIALTDLFAGATVWRGIIAVDTATPNGPALLHFSAVDSLGNTSSKLADGSTYYAVVVDTVPPNAPQFLNAAAKAGGGIQVGWSQPAGGAPASYRLYRATQPLTSTAGLSPVVSVLPDGSGAATYTDSAGLADGATYYYAAAALDQAGNEGPLSNDAYALCYGMAPSPPASLTAGVDESVPGSPKIKLRFSAGPRSNKFNIYRSTNAITSLAGLSPVAVNQTAIQVAGMLELYNTPGWDSNFHYVLTALDAVGNESAASSDSGAVLFDKAPPVISVSGVADGGFYKTAVCPSFSAQDSSLVGSTASVNGARFESGECVSNEGGYQLIVVSSDTGARYSTKTLVFTIDKTFPVITLSGVAAGTVYHSSVSVTAQITEPNLSTQLYLLANHTSGTTTYYASGNPITQDGSYTLTVSATDYAGNSGSAAISFLIDAPPPAPAGLTAVIEQGRGAALAWSRSATDVAGYRVYKNGVRISASILNSTRTVDNAFDGRAAVVYEVAQVDAIGQEGTGAAVTLPAMDLELLSYGVSLSGVQALTRGFFDAIAVSLANRDSRPLTLGPFSLEISTGSLALAAAQGGAVNVAAGSIGISSAIVSVRPDWPQTVNARVRLSLPVESAASAFLVKNFTLEVREPAQPIVEIFPGAMLAGGSGQARVKLYNRGSASMDVRCAATAGGQPAPVENVTVRLKTIEGFLVSKSGIAQAGAGTLIYSGPPEIRFIRIEPGSSFLFDPISLFVPGGAGALIAEAEVSTPTHSLTWDSIPGSAGFRSRLQPVSLSSPPYTATISADRSIYDQAARITLTGYASDNAGVSLAGAPVKLGITHKGFLRTAVATTSITADAFGKYPYAHTFVPIPSEAGIYEIGASHPEMAAKTGVSSFTIVGFEFQYPNFTAAMVRNSSVPFTVELVNLGETSLKGLGHTINVITGGTGVSLTLDAASLPAELAAGARARLSFIAYAGPAAPADAQLNLAVSEANGYLRNLPVYLKVSQAQPIPQISPAWLQFGLIAGQTEKRIITLKNAGYLDWKGVQVSAPVLDWVRLNNSTKPVRIGDIPAGKSASILLSFEPPGGLATGSYARTPLFTVSSDNSQQENFNAETIITSDLTGGLVFVTHDGDTAAGTGIAGSSATLTSLDARGLVYKATADSNGVIRFQNLPVGGYSWRIEKETFNPTRGNAVVETGISKSMEAVLIHTYVTYEWSVTPTTIIDKYELKLDLTFKTDVPQPALVIEPPHMDLFARTGDVIYTQYKVTNKGRVSVYNYKISTSAESDALKLEPLFSSIPEIKAGESVVVPLKITLVHASCNQGSAGGCGTAACVFGTEITACSSGMTVSAGDTCDEGDGGGGGRVPTGGGVVITCPHCTGDTLGVNVPMPVPEIEEEPCELKCEPPSAECMTKCMTCGILGCSTVLSCATTALSCLTECSYGNCLKIPSLPPFQPGAGNMFEGPTIGPDSTIGSAVCEALLK